MLYLFLVSPPHTPSFPPTLCSKRVLPHPPTHFCLTPLALPFFGEWSLHRTKHLPSHWCHIRWSSDTYLAEPLNCPCILFVWWFSLWELWGVWLVDIVVLPMGLQTPSSPSVLPLTPSLRSQCSVQGLDPSTCICIGQALAEPLRRQLYQAPVSKLFMVSAIGSGFGVCRWDESLGGTISG